MATLTFKKDNKVISAPDTSADYYAAEGYDQVEVDPTTKQYKVVKPAVRKSVPYSEFLKVQSELAALKAQQPAEQPKADEKQAQQPAKK